MFTQPMSGLSIGIGRGIETFGAAEKADIELLRRERGRIRGRTARVMRGQRGKRDSEAVEDMAAIDIVPTVVNVLPPPVALHPALYDGTDDIENMRRHAAQLHDMAHRSASHTATMLRDPSDDFVRAIDTSVRVVAGKGLFTEKKHRRMAHMLMHATSLAHKRQLIQSGGSFLNFLKGAGRILFGGLKAIAPMAVTAITAPFIGAAAPIAGTAASVALNGIGRAIGLNR
jgi:hypothetical protein